MEKNTGKLLSLTIFIWLFTGLTGIIYWFHGDFLAVELVGRFALIFTIALVVAPVILITRFCWRYNPSSVKQAKNAPRWVIRYLSPVMFFFLFSYPLYFFFSIAAPCIYTYFYGAPGAESLVVSKKYKTGKRKNRYWISFANYEGSLRVSKREFEQLGRGDQVSADVIKSNLGVSVVALNTDLAPIK